MGDLFDHAPTSGTVPIPVGYDQGNDDVKIVIPKNPDGILRLQDDGKTVADVARESFPSRWASYHGANWGIGGKVLALRIDDGPPFAFGDAASLLSGVRERRSDGQIIRELLAAALWKSGIGADGKPTPIILGSGTPLGVFDQTAAGIKAGLQGRTLTIHAGNETRQFIVQQVIMRPQGVAAILYLLAIKQLPQNSGIGLVVDIGGGTTDGVAIDLRSGEPLRDFCFSAPLGMGGVTAQMARHMETVTGFTPPNHLAREALNSPVPWCQKMVGGPEAAAPLLQDLADQVQDVIIQKLGSALRKVTALIPVGGGAAAELAQSTIGRQLESVAPGTLVAISPEDLPFTNALGDAIAAERAYHRGLR